ncbi:unnamed protein product [Arctogadus glacialis]
MAALSPPARGFWWRSKFTGAKFDGGNSELKQSSTKSFVVRVFTQHAEEEPQDRPKPGTTRDHQRHHRPPQTPTDH